MRVVIIGLGIQGTKRTAIAGSEAVCSVDAYKASADYRDIRDVPLSSFDAAIVCTPDTAKFDILRYLLENKKHVMVEKPLLSADDSQLFELAQLAKNNRVACYTAYNHRFEPHFVRVHDSIRSGELGKLYSLSVFYGNGTARDVRLSEWRDQHMGVFSDIGSHLFDTLLYFFGRLPDFDLARFDTFENQACDNFVLIGEDRALPRITLEASLLSWRNTFRLDLIGELGSLHIDCLCKWGPSTFTKRKRVLPSGRPTEEAITLQCSDPTWAEEYNYFKRLCLDVEETLARDVTINRALNDIWERGRKL